jgi:HK97 family phage major capsid protein/HK97 family phage prohead protease
MDIVRRKLNIEQGRKGQAAVVASISSEELVDRYFGKERLVHSSGAIDLSRAANGRFPLLFNHNPDEPIGAVENVRVEGGKLRADLTFGNSQRAKDIEADVKQGLLSGISIGYRINKMERDQNEEEVYNVVDWTLLETSIAPVAADASVGVGRSIDISIKGEEMDVKQERERASEILALGKRLNKHDLAQQYVADGRSVEDFRMAVLDSMGTATPVRAPSEPMELGMTDKEIRQFSFMRAIRAQMDPKLAAEAGLEIEASKAWARMLGKEPEGLFVPYDVLTRGLTVGTDSAGGYMKPTDHLGGSFIELLRNRMLVKRLGATILSSLRGDVAIPSQTGGATAYWVAEGGNVTASQQTLGQVTLSPKTVGGLTEFTRKLMLQASPDVEMMVRSDLAQVLAVEIDRAAINGSGASNEPTGILNTTGIGDVAGGTNGAAPTWDNILDLESALALANADLGSLGYLTNNSVRRKLKSTTKIASSTFSDFIWENGNDEFARMNGYRAAASENVPSDLDKGTSTGVCSAIIFGNFADLIIGDWGGLDILVDPYTNSASGGIRIVAMQDIDIAVRHAASFAAMQDALTT